MSKVLMLNGSPHQKGCVDAALAEVASELQKCGIESEIVQVGAAQPKGCNACGYCKTHGKCAISDLVNEVGARLDGFDALIAGSPVYFSGASGQICSFMDRLFSAYGGKLCGKIGAAVVSCRRGGATAAFQRRNQYFLIENMLVVGSQYWNMVHGFTAEDARSDLEGMQTMRTLARNIAWILGSIQKAGVHRPVYEPHVQTNFGAY